MPVKVHTSQLFGFAAQPVTVEADASNSLPGIVVVGMGNKSIDESRERIKSAIRNSGYKLPAKRITLNLAPAGLPKQGTGLDLPMTLAVLAVSSQIEAEMLQGRVFIGELGLDGSLRPVNGIIGHIAAARKAGAKEIIIPARNALQAALVRGVEVRSAETLQDVCRHLTAAVPLPIVEAAEYRAAEHASNFSHIAGQAFAKRALEITAAGQHNIMLQGPPGTGKSALARCLPSILPPLHDDELETVTHLHSLHTPDYRSDTGPPLRAPHHSASRTSLLGGGVHLLPGDVSLAHAGILLLDEMPEFPRSFLESLRQPLEDGCITISRAQGHVRYPASFMLVGTRNPCPCGNLGNKSNSCSCSTAQIANYSQRISGPLLDRIDLHVTIDKSETVGLMKKHDAEPSQDIARRVSTARARQRERQAKPNARLNLNDLRTTANISDTALEFIDTANERLRLSSRGYLRALRVARTIADLDGSPEVKPEHMAEALQFRQSTQPVPI